MRDPGFFQPGSRIIARWRSLVRDTCGGGVLNREHRSRGCSMSRPMIPSERAEFSAIVDRPPLKLPNNARLIFWTIVNYEVWDIGRPMARQVIPAPTGQVLLPDVPNWSWHEYGMRVGAWRFYELFKRLGIKPTLAANARICEDYPRVAHGGQEGRLGVHGPRLRPASDPQERKPGGDDQSLDGRDREVRGLPPGRLARTRPDADARHARIAGQGRRAIHRRLGL